MMEKELLDIYLSCSEAVINIAWFVWRKPRWSGGLSYLALHAETVRVPDRARPKTRLLPSGPAMMGL